MKQYRTRNNIGPTNWLSLLRRLCFCFIVSIFVFQLSAPLYVFAQSAEDEEPPTSEYGDLGDDLTYPYYSNADSGSCSSGGSGGGGGEVAADFTLGPVASPESPTPEETKARQAALVAALARDYGLTPEQAAGPVGNFMHESGGFHLPPNVNEGGTYGPPAFSGGYGWAQWTGGRQDTFMDYAAEKGLVPNRNSVATDAANYAYLKKELNEGYQETITKLKGINSNNFSNYSESQEITPISIVEAAAVSFEETFERAGVVAHRQRADGATIAFNAYQELGGGSGCGAGACTDDGKYCFPLSIQSKSEVNQEMFQNNTAIGGHPTYTAYDILVDEGTEVLAFMSGKVVQVGEDRCPGRYVTIFNQEENVSISYMHMKYDNHVLDDQEVQPGEHVGISGNTQEGCTTPHLHIDSIDGDTRYGCSRLGCDYADLFNDIGPQLYEAFQKIPD